MKRAGLITDDDLGEIGVRHERPRSSEKAQTMLASSGSRRMSDSERASLVLRVAEADPGDPAVAATLDEQLDRMASNSTIASMLLTLEAMGALAPERVREVAIERIQSNSTRPVCSRSSWSVDRPRRTDVLRVAPTLGSESTRASLVLAIARGYDDDPRTYDEVLDVLPSFASNSTLASLLLSLDAATFLATEQAVAIAAGELESNSTLAGFLRTVQEEHPSDRAVRDAVIDAYEAIVSHSTLANALGDALDDGYFDAVETLQVAANGLRDWDGISRQRRVGGGCASRTLPGPARDVRRATGRSHRHETRFRDAYFDAAESMRTPAVRERLMQHLTD